VLDEFEVEEAIRLRGIIGQVDQSVKTPILDSLLSAPYLNTSDKARLKIVFAL
jgi:hypothetical protein